MRVRLPMLLVVAKLLPFMGSKTVAYGKRTSTSIVGRNTDALWRIFQRASVYLFDFMGTARCAADRTPCNFPRRSSFATRDFFPGQHFGPSHQQNAL